MQPAGEGSSRPLTGATARAATRATGGARGKALVGAVLGLMVLALPGCGGDSLPKLADLNPFAEKEIPLPGERKPVLRQETIRSDAYAASRPVTLPPQQVNESWSQPGGTPTNAPGHLALSGSLKQVWSANVGTGSSFYGKVTASPIVYQGKVLALDAAGQVTAVNASNGSVAWRASTTPPTEKDWEGYGGGLAADGGRVYVATGFGTVVALDVGSGRKLWEKSLGPPVRASPTAAAQRVFAITKEGQVYCLSGSDGTELWMFSGMPERASILANASPAVDGDTVVVPYPTGDLVALRASNGQPMWQDSLARSAGGSSLGAMSDVARPVLYNGVVYAVGHGGRMIATSQKSGDRVWSLNVASIEQPWVAGDSVFVVDTSGQMIAVTRNDGKVRWTTKLGAGTWAGPVLAGGRLWAVSSKGQLASVDPSSGKIGSTDNLGYTVFIAPVVAGGRMYVLTDDARLLAFN